MGIVVPILVAVVALSFVTLLAGALSSRKGKEGARKKRRGIHAKDRHQALKEANRRLAVNPKDPDALAVVGETQFVEGDWEKAFKTYETLVEVSAGNPEVDEFDANKRYGLAALRLNRLEEAYKGFVIARTVRPDDFEVNYNIGYLEFQKRQYDKAVVAMKQALVRNPDYAPALRYLGHALFKNKQYREALGVLRKAVDLSPDDKESLYAIAECYFELQQVEQALKIFQHLRADPVLGPSASLFAGSIHLNQRQFQKAILDFEIGLKHPDVKIETLVELKYRLAAAYLREQEIAKAVGILTEVQTIHPNYKDVAQQLGKYRELNTNRNLQIYLLAATSEFVTLCRKIALAFFPKAKIKITDIQVAKNDWADILAEVETSRWSDIVLFRFFRTTGTVGELMVRDFHARIKDLKAGKGYCLTAGGFTDEAKKFVEARLIDLIEKPKLMPLLDTIDARQKGLLVED